MKFTRTSVDTVSISPATGFNATGNFDAEYTFSLSQTLRYLAGAISSTISNTGSGDFTPLYDEWRIDAVELAFMFGANSFVPGSLVTPMLPIMNIVYDPTDSSAISLSSILQYQELHTVQLGNQQQSSNGYTLRCKPLPRIIAGTTTTYLVPTNTQWCNIDSPSVEHFGVKMVYDPAGSSAGTIGSLTIYVKYFYSFRRSH